MFSYPKRKTYKYIIPTIKGDCVLKVKQATAGETNEYIEILTMITSDDVENRLKWMELRKEYVTRLINDSYPIKWYQIRKKYILSLVVKDIGNYINDILELVHATRDSIYKDTSSPRINGKKWRTNRFDWINDMIYKNTWIPINQIELVLTREQIWRYIDKNIFTSYEWFKEWMNINDYVFSKQWLNKEQQNDLELIKKHLHNNK